MTLIEELFQAALGAPDGRKRDALRVLLGESPAAPKRETEPYLSLQECSRRLGVSVCTLWRWDIPGHELGGRRRFRISEVEAYLESEAFKKRARDLKAARRESRKEVARRKVTGGR